MRVKRLFRSPQLFPPKPPEDSLKAPNNPTRPASFLRQFSPQHSPVARPFRGKRGLFCPQRPPYPPPKGARTPRFTPAPHVFARRAPGWSPGLPRFCPGPPAPAHTPGTPVAPACSAFRPACARSCAVRRPKKPRRRRNPARQASRPARCRRPPPEVSPPAPPRHILGTGNPDCRGRLSHFAVEKCATPRGDQIPGHDG